MPCAIEKRVVLNDPFSKTLYVDEDVRPYLTPLEMRLKTCSLERILSETTAVLYSELVSALPVQQTSDDDESSVEIPPSTRPPRPLPAPSPPQTSTPAANVPAFVIEDNPDAHQLRFAPCANGTVFRGAAVVWQEIDYSVKALSVGGGNRVFAHIISLDEEISASIPCSLLNLKVGIRPASISP